MKKLILLWGSVAGIILLAGILLYRIYQGASEHSNVTPISDRLEYYKLYADLAKAVFIGFGTALLAILIPAVLAEARFSFEQLKASRTAYSEAKTGFDYLPLRICMLDMKAASALIQRVHVRKHEAELYPELPQHLKRRGITKEPDQWGDGIYNDLFELRTALEDSASQWDSWTPTQRLSRIWNAIGRRKKEHTVNEAIDPEERYKLLPKSRRPAPEKQEPSSADPSANAIMGSTIKSQNSPGQSSKG